MGHPAALIQRILAKVQEDYPAEQFNFTLEKGIPGTRMQPDILVRRLDGNLQCAVEIGYTRPEKLTAYRNDLKIPDVRWYDKAGNLHADVTERVVRVSIETEPQTSFVLYAINDYVECHSETCEREAAEEWNAEVGELTRAMTKQEEGDLIGEMFDLLAVDTTLYILTDYLRVWFCLFCDKCGEAELISEDYSVDVWAIADELREYGAREFASHWGARKDAGGWSRAKTVFAEFGIEMHYEHGDYLDRETAKLWDRSLATIRTQAVS